MVAVIKHSRSVNKTFYYNENKVKEGVASCLMAENYPLELDRLSQDMRLGMLEKVAALRPGVTKPTLHITLNFPPEEQHSEELLKQLATEYMDRIGFGEQPYLVYQHFDAGHQHLHIVTLRVKPDGEDISVHNIGKNLSEPARKAMEIKYGLVRADDHKAGLFEPQAIDARKLDYGKVSTKRAMSNILASVLDKYKYASLPELNAVLKLYNVQAERGREDSRLYKYRGLIYRVIGPDGTPVSAPVKASAFAYKARLADIEKRFLRNDVERQRSKPAVRVAVDKALRQPGVYDFATLKEALKKTGVDLVMHHSKDGRIYGLTYIDHRNKAVFNGKDLGTNYAAKAVAERLAEQLIQQKNNTAQELIGRQKAAANQLQDNITGLKNTGSFQPEDPDATRQSILEILLQSEYSSNYLPPELRRTRRKKRRRIIK